MPEAGDRDKSRFQGAGGNGDDFRIPGEPVSSERLIGVTVVLMEYGCSVFDCFIDT